MLKQIKNKISTWRKNQVYRKFYSQFITSGDLCFDVGANIGSRTAIFLSLKAKVISVEPTQQCCTILNTNFGANTNFHLSQVALGDDEGTAEIHVGNYHEVSTLSLEFIKKYSGQAQHNIYWDRKEKVKVTTLENLIKQYGLPVFCKIDVEGYELEVLKGLSQPLPFMSFEYNAKLKNKALDCVKHLAKFNGLYFNFSPYETMKFSLPEWVGLEEFHHYILTLPEETLTGDIYVKHTLLREAVKQ